MIVGRRWHRRAPSPVAPNPNAVEKLDAWLKSVLRRTVDALAWGKAGPGDALLPEERSDHGPFGQVGPNTIAAVKAGATALVRTAASPFGALITLTIGDRSVRLMVARGNRVRRWAEAELPEGVVQDGLIVDEDTFSAALNGLITTFRKNPKINGQRVAVAITGRNVVQRRFTVFVDDGDDMTEAILEASAERMSIRTEELQLDWDVAPAEFPEANDEEQDNEKALENLEAELEPEPEGEPHDVYAFGVYRHVLNRNLRILSLTGPRFAGVQPKAMALAAATNERSGVVLDVEANSITAIVLRDGLPEVVREVSVDGRLTQEQWIQSITTQVSRSVAFHDSLYPDTPIGPDAPLFITGAGRSDAGEAEAGAQRLPFIRLELPPTLRAPEDFPFDRYAANVGLALVSGKRFWQRMPVPLVPRAKLDFRPAEYRPRPFPVRTVLAGALVTILTLGLGAAYQLTNEQIASASSAESVLESVETRLDVRSRQTTQAKTANEQLIMVQTETETILAAVNAIKHRDRGFADAIDTVTSLAPVGAVIQEIDDDGELLSVRAAGDSYEVLLEYVRLLEAAPEFTAVRIRSLGVTASAAPAAGPGGQSPAPGGQPAGPAPVLTLRADIQRIPPAEDPQRFAAPAEP